VKGSFGWQPVECPLTDDDVLGRLTSRYEAAFAEYQDLVIKNTELNMTGCRLSRQARRKEELAFDELDSARHALLSAAALVYPTIH
jgi:hypothetical protein